MMIERVRFAPSPTGYLHIGNLRGVLFNYIYAKKNKGRFILRIDDTDLERSQSYYEQALIDDLAYYDIHFDEGPHKGGDYGPYRQSERLDIYQKYAKILFEKGYAKKEKTEKGEAIILKGTKSILFNDIIFGSINKEVEDFVIIKSNGYPTYHFASVIDDHLMKISCIIRGQDHLGNTAKHVLIYRYLDWDLPRYAHYSLTLNLSKRDRSQSLRFFKEEGYMKEAVLNSAMLLGWYPADQKEKFLVFDKIDEFEVQDLKKVNVHFDFDKLKWLSKSYLKEKSFDFIYEKALLEFKKNLSNDFFELYNQNELKIMIENTIERSFCLKDFFSLNQFYFQSFDYDREYFFSHADIEQNREISLFLKSLSDQIESQNEDVFKDLKSIKALIRETAKNFKIKAKTSYLSIRYAISYSFEGADLSIIMSLLKKKKVLQRLHEFLSWIHEIEKNEL